MTFLNPAILFGMLAASIPIVLHFMNLRKLKKIEFSTLAFLKELQKTKIRKLKFKQWLLLLLRILIITFLVLAFARPTVKNISIGSSSAKTTAVIIIDNTFSMSVVSSNGSYFNKAKQTAKSLLGNFQNGDEIAIIPVSDLSNDTHKPATNFSFVKKRIDEIQISLASKTLNEAVIKAGQILYESKNFNKEIYLLTDLQSGRISGDKNEIVDLSSLINGARFYLIDLHDKDAVNLGVDDFYLNNQIFEKNKTINFSTVVHNYSNITVNNSVASLFINGKRSAQQSISIPANESTALNFETTLLDTGTIQASVEIEDDDINQDNKRFVSFYVPDNINLLILTNSRDDSKFVKLALANYGNQSINISENTFEQIPSLNLSKFNAVFTIGSGNGANYEKLFDYLESGNSLVIMPDSKSSLKSMRDFLKSINIPEPTSFIGKQNDAGTAAQFGKMNLRHPLFTDFFDDNSKVQIESPDIYYYMRMNPGTLGKIIIPMYDNSAFLSEFEIGNSKVLVYNTCPVLSCTNFPMKSLFAPLMNKSLLYIISKTHGQQNIYAGQDVTANIFNSVNKQIKIINPNNTNDYVNTDSLINKKYLDYSKTDLTGVYRFYSGDKLMDFSSVNCDPKESVVSHYSGKDFQNYLDEIGFDGKLLSIKPGDNFYKTIYQSRFGTELWKYFLILALLLALIEMFVARSSKKDLNGIE
jgi:hypothetical protein